MPKIKAPRKSTAVDMTAMCDVSFLLLTFFILTSKFKPAEPVAVDIPSSRSEIPVPDVLKISVDKEGKAYVSFPSAEIKLEALNNIGEKYGDRYPYMKTLTEAQKKRFKDVEMMGFTMEELPAVLNKRGDEISKLKMSGIPMDSVNNQLGDWIMATRYASPKLRIAIKGDKFSDVEAIQKVIKVLTQKELYTFNLITSLRGGGAAPAEK